MIKNTGKGPFQLSLKQFAFALGNMLL